MDALIEAYPLTWPLGEPRTPAYARKTARFSTSSGRLTISTGLARLKDELRMLHATDIVVSTNIPLRRDGLPLGNVREPSDPGVTVYFRVKGTTLAYPCDKWDRVADNLAAIAAHLNAQRGQARWGVGRREQVYAGYRALPAVGDRRAWYETLGFKEAPRTRTEVETKFKELARRLHPDVNPSPAASAQMGEICAARDEGYRSYNAAGQFADDAGDA